MFETLFSKTFAILSLQLLITWGATVYAINWYRKIYRQRIPGYKGRKNKAGEIDYPLNFDFIKVSFWVLLASDFIVFFLLLFFGKNNLPIGLPLFCVWSILTGIFLALCLLSVDENLGGKVLAITCCITAVAALIGLYSDINFMFLGLFLFWALILLLLGNTARLFISIPRASQRVMALLGSIIFTGYLLFDFARLEEAGKERIYNTWPVAMEFSIDIYLDVINLFLELLDLLSE